MFAMVFETLFACSRNIALLVDPDKVTKEVLEILAKPKVKQKLSAIFVGGSLVFNDTALLSEKLKQICGLPVVLFPGNLSQVNPHVDALLFLSLISGRNPEYLIGQHVVSAPIIKKMGLETIPTGYMLFDCGSVNSVRYMSNTLPIPNNKPDIAVATALAGEMLGMKTLYLEAGSGAQFPVATETIKAVRAAVNIPLIVGGGLRTAEQINAAFEAGANLVVVGTAFEMNPEILEVL
jgi:putative glycerol-1-phosphate prenyltransferase